MPAGAQGVSDPGEVIKSYLRASERRLEKAKYVHSARRTRTSNQHDDAVALSNSVQIIPQRPAQPPLAAVFGPKARVHHARQLSMQYQRRPPQTSTHATKRSNSQRQQMLMNSIHAMDQGSSLFASKFRGKATLADKLDAISRSSMWKRRRDVTSNANAIRNVAKLRSASRSAAAIAKKLPREKMKEVEMIHGPTEMEKAKETFRKFLRMWRSRKQSIKTEAFNRINQHNGKVGACELPAEASAIVSIISKRIVREVPALKFFDDRDDSVNGSSGKCLPSQMTAHYAPIRSTEDNTPRGVCYTLDSRGCREVKIASSEYCCADTDSRLQRGDSSLEAGFSIEKATARALRRKMARRVRSKKLSFFRMRGDFARMQKNANAQLDSSLALKAAEGEKLKEVMLTTAMANNTTLPLYRSEEEMQLARLRYKKAVMLERCKTLNVLGELLEYVGQEDYPESRGSEMRCLELFRLIIERDQVLTRLVCEGIRAHMSQLDLQDPVVQGMLEIMEKNAE